MSADKISAPYAIFYTKLGKNLQKFFHWRTLRKSPARSHNKRFFFSFALRGRREFAKQTAEGAKPLNGSPHCGAPQWEPALRGRRKFAKQTAEGAEPLNGCPHCGPPQWKPVLRVPSMEARTTGRQNLRIILHCGRWLLFLSRLNYAA